MGYECSSAPKIVLVKVRYLTQWLIFIASNGPLLPGSSHVYLHPHLHFGPISGNRRRFGETSSDDVISVWICRHYVINEHLLSGFASRWLVNYFPAAIWLVEKWFQTEGQTVLRKINHFCLDFLASTHFEQILTLFLNYCIIIIKIKLNYITLV